MAKSRFIRIVFFLIMAFPSLIFSQRGTIQVTKPKDNSNKIDSVIFGKWRECTSEILDSNQNCASSASICEFSKDGTYSESNYYVILGKKYQYHGTWYYKEGVLVMEMTSENGISALPQKHRINWITNSLFFYTGREGEGPDAPIFYTCFKKQVE